MFFFKRKPKTPQANRREQYRQLPKEVGGLDVVLRGPGESLPLRCELTDLSVQGLGLQLPGRRNPDLVAGDIYEVVIGSSMHPDILTPVQLRSAHEQTDCWRYGFEFIDTGGLYDQLDDFFVRFFNRRGNRRMRLMAQERIKLHMSWEGGHRDVAVYDVSGSGVGFALSAQDLPAIDRGQRLELSFRLPGNSAELTGHGTLARITLLADRFVLGIAFDLDEPEGLGQHRGTLDRFVQDRAKLREAWNNMAS